MIPGPVFTFELLRTSRRGSFYVMRAAYAAILLWAFYTVYQTWVTWGGDEPPMTAMKALAISSFGAVAVSQVAFILAITPALVAGVIAEEKQRKTLHYLLASRLSGPEIVLGKLLARMLHAARVFTWSRRAWARSCDCRRLDLSSSLCCSPHCSPAPPQ